MAGQMKRKLTDALMSWGSDEEENANNNEHSEDDETESEPERPGKRDADIVADSDSASDAAEDLDATSSDDDGEEETPIKVKAERGASGRGRKERVSDEDVEGFNLDDDSDIDFGDDDDDEDDDDEDNDDGDDDEDDNETEDEEHGEDVDEMPIVRQVSSADFEQQARYEEEEEEIVVKEEQGLRSLFGDDEDDEDDEDEDEGDRISQRSATTAGGQDERAEEEDEVADSKHLSFTVELLSNGTGSVVDDTGDADDQEGEEVVRATSLRIDAHERLDAKSLLSSIIANVSVRENKVLKRGDALDGPPIEDPIAHIDEFKRFSQDPLEIYNDYELKLKKPAPSNWEQLVNQAARPNQRQRRTQSAFAKAPRPLVEAAAAVAATAQQQQQLLSRKRKRSQNNADPTCDDVSAAALTTVARIGERFTDRFLESLIGDNAAALQGNNDGYSQRSWIPLPVTWKPAANWRFVLENAMKNCSRGNSSTGDSVCPPLRKEYVAPPKWNIRAVIDDDEVVYVLTLCCRNYRTLQRIRDRLKTLNTLPWKNDDDQLLDKVDRLPDTSAAPPAQLPAVDLRSDLANDGNIVML